MGRAPVEPAAVCALGEPLVGGIDVGRNPKRDQLTGDLDQLAIAERATRKCAASRVERRSRVNLAKLSAEVLAFEVDDVGRGAKPLVAREHDAMLGARRLQNISAAERRRVGDIHAEQPEPTGESAEHPVGGEARGFLNHARP